MQKKKKKNAVYNRNLRKKKSSSNVETEVKLYIACSTFLTYRPRLVCVPLFLLFFFFSFWPLKAESLSDSWCFQPSFSIFPLPLFPHWLHHRVRL